jgi:hypothetical protein
MSDVPVLPTIEEMAAAWEACSDALEGQSAREAAANESGLAQLKGRVLAVTNFEDDQEVTFDQVGRLLGWCDDVRGLLECSLRDLSVIEKSLIDLARIASEGRGDVPHFDEQGRSNYPSELTRIRRALIGDR